MTHLKILIVLENISIQKERILKAILYICNKESLDFSIIEPFIQFEDIIAFKNSHILRDNIDAYGYIIAIGDRVNEKIKEQYIKNDLIAIVLPPTDTWDTKTINCSVRELLTDLIESWYSLEVEKKLIVFGDKFENKPIIDTHEITWLNENLDTIIQWLKIELKKGKSFGLRISETPKKCIEIRDINRKLRTEISEVILILSNKNEEALEVAKSNGFGNCYLIDLDTFIFMLRVSCSSSSLHIKINNES